MAGNTFGKLLQITSFGESHGAALGVIVDGCPAGLELNLDSIRYELARRKPGQSKLVTQRKEDDEFEILSGIFEGKTTGTPIAAIFRNKDVKSKDYDAIKNLFRPGHADFTYFAKYTHRDYRGGGRSSARETVARVFGGALAKQILNAAGVHFCGGVIQVGKVKAKTYDWAQVEENELRSVDPSVITAMREEIETARSARDSVGGIIEVQAHGVPLGLGEPVFEKLDGVIANAMMSIPAVKGVEIGAGFRIAEMRGSESNDEMTPAGFKTNNHGGILGGITSGAPIVVRIAVKPTSSIPQELETIDTNLQAAKILTKGRHDPCVALRAVPIAEAMLALVLADYWLQDLAHKSVSHFFQKTNSLSYGLKK